MQIHSLLVKSMRKLWLDPLQEGKENNSFLQALAENIGCHQDFFRPYNVNCRENTPLPFSSMKAINAEAF